MSVAIDDLVEERVRAWIDVGDRITPIYDLSTSNDKNANSGENNQNKDLSHNFGDPINTFWSTCQIHSLNSSVKSIEADIRAIKSNIRSILDCLNKPKKSAAAASTLRNRADPIDVDIQKGNDASEYPKLLNTGQGDILKTDTTRGPSADLNNPPTPTPAVYDGPAFGAVHCKSDRVSFSTDQLLVHHPSTLKVNEKSLPQTQEDKTIPGASELRTSPQSSSNFDNRNAHSESSEKSGGSAVLPSSAPIGPTVENRKAQPKASENQKYNFSYRALRQKDDTSNQRKEDIFTALENQNLDNDKGATSRINSTGSVTSSQYEDGTLFSEKAVLYTCDPISKEWKCKGSGFIKIMTNTRTGSSRVLMRKEMANHEITKNMQLEPLQGHHNAWSWYAQDFASDKLTPETFSVRFTNKEITEQFEEVFDTCRERVGNVAIEKSISTATTSGSNKSSPFRMTTARKSNKSRLFGTASTSGSNKSKPFRTTTAIDSSKPSLFGTSTTSDSSKPSLFGTATTSDSSKPSLFGKATTRESNTPSLFGTATTSDSSKPSLFETATTSDSNKPSLFGTANTSDSNKPSLFGTATSRESNTPSLFGTATTSDSSKPSLFGMATTSDSNKPSLFGTATTSDSNKPSLFGTATISDSSKPSLYGTATASDSSKPSLFGTANDGDSSHSGLVGTSTTSDSSKPSLFGTSTTSASNKPSLFRTLTTSDSNKPSLFGTSTTSDSSKPSLFGTANAGDSSHSGLFGTLTTSDSNKPGLFGASTTSDSSKPSLFGTSTTSDSNTPSLFETANAGDSSRSGLFGASTTSDSSKPSLFGRATTSDSNKPSLYGTTNAGDCSHSGLFGTAIASDSSKPSLLETATVRDSSKPNLFGTATSSDANKPSMSDENTTRESGDLVAGGGTITTEFDAVNFAQDIGPDDSAKDGSKPTLHSDKTPDLFGDGTRKESYQWDNHGISEDRSGGIAAVTNPEKEEVSRVTTGSSCGSSQHDTNLASNRDGMVIDEDQQLFSERVALSYLNAHGNLKLLGRGNLRVIYDRNLFGARLRLTTDDGDRVCDHIICRRYYVKKACNKENTCQWTARDLSSELPITRTFHARFSTESAVQEFSEMFEKGLRWAAKAGIDEMAEGDTQQHRTLPKSVVS